MKLRAVRLSVVLLAWSGWAALVLRAGEVVTIPLGAAALLPLSLTSWLFGGLAGLAADLGLLFLLLLAHHNGWRQGPLETESLLLVPVAGATLAYAFHQRRQAVRHRVVSQRAQFDPLTGLLNRASFEARLPELIEESKAGAGLLAVLFVDLDRFKAVNDNFGHEVGDELLKAVARALRQNVRQNDLVGRLGGDEFVLAMPNLREPQSAAAVAQKLLKLLNTPFDIQGKRVAVGASIGISLCPSDGEDMASLIKNADHAMYKIKGSGRNRFAFSTMELRSSQTRRQEIERRLRWALEEGELELRYQPQVELSSGETFGMEALLRWKNPDLGLVGPREFVPIAEEIGEMVPIGAWVLHEACAQAASWQRSGRPLRIAVNVSSVQLVQPSFVELVAEALQLSGLPAELLELEVTESVFARDSQDAEGRLRRIERLGVRVALDDFGSGYSSLGGLTRLPVHTLKIEGGFLQGLGEPDGPGERAAIVEAMCALGTKLRKAVVAECVETEAQRRFLQRAGCPYGQGNLFARPMAAHEVEARLGGSWLRPPGPLSDPADSLLIQD